MPDIRLSGRLSGNLPDIERWPDIRPNPNEYLHLMEEQSMYQSMLTTGIVH